MSATIRDIKEKTGLSLATISKYLNGGNVLPENRVRIETAIKELHYEVNEIARGLVTNKTRTVGVVVYSVESLFNGTLLHHIGNALRKDRYGILICDSCNDEEIEAENIRFLIKKKVDGIIVVPVARKSDFLKPALNASIPVVLLDRSLQDKELDCIRIDNRMAAYRAVNILIRHHHEKIAVICSDSKNEYTGYQRYRGYRDAMEQAALYVPEIYEKKGNHSIEYGYESMKELMALEQPPTAVFMSNYEISLGAVMAVNESDFRCPEDISLLGFDDLILSHVVKPRLYMVVQPMKEMGEKAVEILLQRIGSKEKEMPVEIVMSTRISEGDSISTLT
jgi:LacI family transcriptional regulator